MDNIEIEMDQDYLNKADSSKKELIMEPGVRYIGMKNELT